MFGRIAGLRSRNLTRRRDRIRVDSFSRLIRALNTLATQTEAVSGTDAFGYAVPPTSFGNRAIEVVKPIVFEETVDLVLALGSVELISTPGLVHKWASDCTVAFEMPDGGGRDRVIFRGWKVDDVSGKTFLAIGDECNPTLEEVFLGENVSCISDESGDNNRLDMTRVFCEQFDLAGSISDSMWLGCSLDNNGGAPSFGVEDCLFVGNRFPGGLTLTGTGNCAVTGNQFESSFLTTTGSSGGNAVAGNAKVNLSLHASDSSAGNT